MAHGERSELTAADLIDLGHYSGEAGTVFADSAAAYGHFRQKGQHARLNPSPCFFTDWYLWQNPDASKFPTALDHFLAVAADRPIDPAPFIDSVALLRKHPDARSTLDLYRMLVSGELAGTPLELDAQFARLDKARSAFQDRIRLAVIRDTDKPRKNLVWVQSGRSFRPSRWFDPDKPRDWDLLCNWYDLGTLDLRLGDIVLRQSGTKFTGIATVLRERPDILGRYDAVMFIDDDLGFQHEDIDRTFNLAKSHDLDLFQPALLSGSNCVWPDLFQKPGSEMRLTTGAEIMMFGFSRRALDLCAPFFASTASGFGLDLLCSEAVRSNGWRCGIVDAVGVEHREVIDEHGGAYYQFMRSLGINQKFELYRVISELGQKPEFRALRPGELPKDGGRARSRS